MKNLEKEKSQYSYSARNLEQKVAEVKDLEGEIEKIQRSIDRFDNQIELSNSETKNILATIEQMVEKISSSRDIINEINKTKNQLERMHHEKLIPVVGDYGSGKSALCHCVLYQLIKYRDIDCIPIFIPLGQLIKHEELQNNLKKDILQFIRSEYAFL